MIETYGLQTRFGKAIAAQVLVNGVRAGVVDAGHISFQSLAIQPDVLPGANRIEVALAVPAAPGAPPPAGDPETMFAELSLEENEYRDIGDSYEITTSAIADRRWRAAAGAALALPQRLTIEWMAPAATPPPVWTRATPAAADVARTRILAELQTLRELLVARRLGEFQARMRWRNEDMARAFPITGSAARRAAGDTAMLDALLPPAPVPFAPIDAAALHLIPSGGGRVIECAMADGGAPLRCTPRGGEPIEIHTTFAQIDGQFVVIR